MRSPKCKSESKSKTLALSVFVNATEQHQPLPLNVVCYPLRRSPRFTTPLHNAAAVVKMWEPNSAPAAVEGGNVGLFPASSGKSGSRKRKVLHMRMLEFEKPLRRSPRFSASLGTNSLHGVKRQRSRGPELPLNADLKDQKSILDGKCIQEKSFRRSPRLASTHSECERIRGSTSPQKMSVSLAKDTLGVALSNNSNLHSDAKPGLLSYHKETKPFKHSHVKFFSEKNLRRSPRLSPSGYHASEAYVEHLDVKLCSGTKLRRSPRLSFSNGNESSEIVVFQEKRTSKVVHQKKKNTKVVSTSIELSNSPVEQHSKVNTMSRNSTPRDSIQCLRWSSEAITSPSSVENDRTSSDYFASSELDDNPPRKKYKTSASLTNNGMDEANIASFIGDPIPDDEAQKRWGWRYELKEQKCKGRKFKINEGEEDEIIVNIKCHYAQANIGNCIFSLGDCAYIKGEGEEKHVGKIIEFFQTIDSQNYFRVQWFYRIQDTVIQDEGGFHDKRRLFYSSIMNDNLIDCIIAKVNVTRVTPRV